MKISGRQAVAIRHAREREGSQGGHAGKGNDLRREIAPTRDFSRHQRSRSSSRAARSCSSSLAAQSSASSRACASVRTDPGGPRRPASSNQMASPVPSAAQREAMDSSAPSPAQPSTGQAYDPKNDPARKPQKSKDPAWRFGYWPNLQNRDEVACTLCGGHVRGGIKRLKQHLAGGYGDAKLCPSVSTEVRKEMATYLEANKRKRSLTLDDEVVEVAANEAPANATAAAVHPSSGTAAKKRQSSLQFIVVGNKTKPEAKANKFVAEMLQKTPEEIVDERLSGSNQPTIVSSTKTKEEKHYVDTQWSLFFYECGIPFNAAAARQFQIAVEATTQYGSGYKPPTPYQLGDPLLEEAVKSTSTMREEHERAWKHYGCTLMSDGWSDRRGRHLINFLVNSLEGTYFLESIDASSEVHDAYMLAGLLEKKVEEIGKDKVVQVITYNGANFKAAGKLLIERIPTIFWSPCAAHCLDLMLEDIGNLPEFKKSITRARRVTTFIYRHALMNHAKERIHQSFAIESKRSLLRRIMKIIEQRWEKQMDHPLYGAAMYLNPGKLHPLLKKDDDEIVGQLRGCFLDVLARMVEDEETRAKINAQAMDYEYLRGEAFSNKMDKQNLESLSPLDWRCSYGGRAIELQRFARRVVSLCASSSGCEQNWSKFESGKNFDPLVIEDFNWNNEWADSLHVTPQGARGCECDLTWNLVDEAVGASQSLQGRNFPRATHRRGRNSAVNEDELGPENDNEENPDPFDDADVTDCEDDPNDANETGEDNEAANIAGEFDDGY
ncbi:hAT dimerisation domain-containing protein [Striga hermonthica]|uniref:HAT dimerisation domain-containing protein n=1 Tax=Striga hermonthica TaxID=68872 RepID=A0A9N7MMP2_STRHE|nr:hAT dimerisation domain-containing protein [Striga hermonthica]